MRLKGEGGDADEKIHVVEVSNAFEMVLDDGKVVRKVICAWKMKCINLNMDRWGMLF